MSERMARLILRGVWFCMFVLAWGIGVTYGDWRMKHWQDSYYAPFVERAAHPVVKEVPSELIACPSPEIRVTTAGAVGSVWMCSTFVPAPAPPAKPALDPSIEHDFSTTCIIMSNGMCREEVIGWEHGPKPAKGNPIKKCFDAGGKYLLYGGTCIETKQAITEHAPDYIDCDEQGKGAKCAWPKPAKAVRDMTCVPDPTCKELLKFAPAKGGKRQKCSDGPILYAIPCDAQPIPDKELQPRDFTKCECKDYGMGLICTCPALNSIYFSGDVDVPAVKP